MECSHTRGPSAASGWQGPHVTRANVWKFRAVEITGAETGDAPMLPYCFNQIPAIRRLQRDAGKKPPP